MQKSEKCVLWDFWLILLVASYMLSSQALHLIYYDKKITLDLRSGVDMPMRECYRDSDLLD